MSVRCPNGHTSTSTDYCDVCGEPIASSSSGAAGGAAGAAGSSGAAATAAPGPDPLAAATPATCPNCGAPAAAGALFCESCGYDFTTGALPTPDPLSLDDLGGPAASPHTKPTPVVVPTIPAPGVSGIPTPAPGSDPTPTPAVLADPGPASDPAADPAAGGAIPTPAPGSDAADHPVPGPHGRSGKGRSGKAGKPQGAPTPTPPRFGDDSVANHAGSVTEPAGGAPSAASAASDDAWVVELWIDPDWYASQQPEDSLPSVGLPAVLPLVRRSVLVGRPSRSRGIEPDVDCGGDTGVSRRHCQLTGDGQRWWVEDLQSANGTYVAAPGAPLPTTPITPGERRELADGDRVYLGGWTRLVVRRALPGEV